MRVLRGVLLCAFVLAFGAVAQAAPPVFSGSVNVPSSGNITAIGPVNATSLVPVALPTPKAGQTVIGFGDSITYGVGSTGGVCAGVATPTNPNGDCYLDKFATAYGLTEINRGVSGTSLQHDTNGAPSGIDRYQTDVIPNVGPNAWLIIQFGTNDYRYQINGDAGLSPANFRANLATVVSAAIAAGEPATQIILAGLPFNNPGHCSLTNNGNYNQCLPVLQQYTQEVMSVARQYGTRYADTYSPAAQACNSFALQCSNVLADDLHPDPNGHALMATAMENATTFEAISGTYAAGEIAARSHVAAFPVGSIYQGTDGSIRFTQTGAFGANGYFAEIMPNGLQGSFTIPGSNENSATSLQFPNTSSATGSSRFTIIGSAAGLSAYGIPCIIFCVNDYGTTGPTISADGSGNVGVSNNIQVGGQVISSSKIIYAGSNSAVPVGFQMPNASAASGSSKQTVFGTNNGLSATGIPATTLGIGDFGNSLGSYGLTLDQNYNLGIIGALHAGGHNVCSASSGVPCETTITCSLSAATTCSATATVPAGSVCTATANGSDMTTAVEQFKVSLSTNTLTVTELASSSQTATAAANVTCL